MTMPKRVATLLLITVVLLAGSLALGSARVAYGQDPTIPTRTPTPDPNAAQPTNVAPSSTPDNGGDNNPPPPPPAEATATATGTTAAQPLGPTYTPTATATAPGAALPASNGCSDEPYVQAIQQVIVYAGPGSDYAALAVLQPEETRPIAGRAGFATWWQIRMSDTLLGWVPDSEVNEFGNTGKVPVVEPMEINGTTPTPGAPWEPTPLPYVPCDETPTPSPTPTATSTATPAATTASATQMAMVSSSIANDQDAGGSGDAGASGERNAGVQVALPQPDGSTVGKQDTASAAGLDSSGRVSPSQVILPLAGVILVVAGVIVALLSRKPAVSGGATGPENEA